MSAFPPEKTSSTVVAPPKTLKELAGKIRELESQVFALRMDKGANNAKEIAKLGKEIFALNRKMLERMEKLSKKNARTEMTDAQKKWLERKVKAAEAKEEPKETPLNRSRSAAAKERTLASQESWVAQKRSNSSLNLSSSSVGSNRIAHTQRESQDRSKSGAEVNKKMAEFLKDKRNIEALRKEVKAKCKSMNDDIAQSEMRESKESGRTVKYNRVDESLALQSILKQSKKSPIMQELTKKVLGEKPSSAEKTAFEIAFRGPALKNAVLDQQRQNQR